MRRYDDDVEVTRGLVLGLEAPAEFRWRGRPWRVSAVVAHWVETGAWWQSPGAREVIGSADTLRPPAGPTPAGPIPARPWDDLLAEQERWRVEAHRPERGHQRSGVFDLVLDWSDGRWRLVGCAD